MKILIIGLLNILLVSKSLAQVHYPVMYSQKEKDSFLNVMALNKVASDKGSWGNWDTINQNFIIVNEVNYSLLIDKYNFRSKATSLLHFDNVLHWLVDTSTTEYRIIGFFEPYSQGGYSYMSTDMYKNYFNFIKCIQNKALMHKSGTQLVKIQGLLSGYIIVDNQLLVVDCKEPGNLKDFATHYKELFGSLRHFKKWFRRQTEIH